jgi:hypothetical protein
MLKAIKLFTVLSLLVASPFVWAENVFKNQAEKDTYLKGCKEDCKTEECKLVCDCSQKNVDDFFNRAEFLEAGQNGPLKPELETKMNQMADFCLEAIKH